MAGQSVKQMIVTTSQKYGVDPNVALSIAQVESGLNPGAVGDNGTSFGVYQLHQGGGQGDGYSQSQLFDPSTNINIGIKNMAAAYHAGVAQGLTGYALDKYTADHSGHPDQTGQMPGTYDAKLQQAWSQVNGGGGSTGSAGTSSSNSGDQAAAWVSDNKNWVTITAAGLGLVLILGGIL